VQIDSKFQILAVQRQTRHCRRAWMLPAGFAFETIVHQLSNSQLSNSQLSNSKSEP